MSVIVRYFRADGSLAREVAVPVGGTPATVVIAADAVPKDGWFAVDNRSGGAVGVQHASGGGGPADDFGVVDAGESQMFP